MWALVVVKAAAEGPDSVTAKFVVTESEQDFLIFSSHIELCGCLDEGRGCCSITFRNKK